MTTLQGDRGRLILDRSHVNPDGSEARRSCLVKMAMKAASSAIAKEAQLPRDRPGVIIVEFPYALVDMRDATTRVAAKLAANRPKTDRIAGFVFFANYNDTSGRHVGLRAFDNPTATVRLDQLPWTLLNAHGRPPAPAR
jgi:hypothetical protein